MSPAEVADGVFRLGTKWANFYLLVDDGEATLIDAGYPNYGAQITEALPGLGLASDAVSAVVVTHHHVDHAGTAEQCRREAGATVYVHEADAAIVRGGRRSPCPARLLPPSVASEHGALPGTYGRRRRGALPPCRGPRSHQRRHGPRRAGPSAGHPDPGHTAGHCSVLVEDRGALFAADAMVNFDYASGERGLRLHRFNEDRQSRPKPRDSLKAEGGRT